MEKISIDTIEIGNLLFGHSRGNFVIDRKEFGDIFLNFLESAGFDFYGFPCRKLEDFVKVEDGKARKFKPCHISPEELRIKGKHVKSEEMWLDYYELDGNTYCISGHGGKEFEKAWYEWFDSFPEDDANLDSHYEKEPSEEDYPMEFTVHLVEDYIEHNHYFDNGSFLIRPYYWGESEEIKDKPNFVFHETGLEISWYKYPLRDSYCNYEIDSEELKNILNKCLKSLPENVIQKDRNPE